jgi:DNA polymerase III subunit delta
MVALKPTEIDRFIARPDPGRPIVLVFGPDTGLVRERAAALIKASVDDPNDPFSLARLDGDDLAGEPGRLVEEATTVPLFGGRRAVWVKSGSRNLAPAVEALIPVASPDCRVVIEAGDLKKSSPLRAVCEKAKNAAALACYIDNAAALARLVDDEMRAASLTISPDARAALLPLLGGDRLASRSEIQKLATFARDKGKVELDDVLAVVADASTLTLDALIDAAFAGRTSDLETQFGKAQIAGTSPGAIMSAAQRQVAALHRGRLALDTGASADEAINAMQGFVHFSRKSAVENVLRSWTSARLARAMAQLAEAALDVRKQPTMGEAIAQRTLLSLAVNARRKE